MKALSESTVKRIVVAVDASPGSLAPLEMAVDLAARMQAQLETLFVEDINLLRLAELPFAKELDRSSGEARALDETTVASAMRAKARHLQQLLQGLSTRRQIQTNLRVVRGNYLTEAVQAKSDISFMFASKRISTEMTRQQSKSVEMPSNLRHVAPVYVFYPGHDESRRPLVLAADVADLLGTDLVVLLPAGTDNDIDHLKKNTLDILNINHGIRFRTVDADLADCPGIIAASGCSLLVIGRHDVRDQLTDPATLEAIHCALALVH